MSRLIPSTTFQSRGRAVAVAVLCAGALSLLTAASAFAFSEIYGNFVENGGFAQSAGAHSFVVNDGAGGQAGTIACQLFNHSGVNEVTHGNQACAVGYGGGQFVWARVYNEIGKSETVAGEAIT